MIRPAQSRSANNDGRLWPLGKLLLAALAIAAALGAAGPAQAAFGTPDVYLGNGKGGRIEADRDAILALAERRGRIPVIVGIRTGFDPEATASPFEIATQRRTIAAKQRRIVARVPGPQNVKLFETVPYVGMLVDATGLRALLTDSDVVSIREDIARRATLDDSVPLIRADRVSKRRGIRGGKGWTVAVLDTGVQRNHPALKGKIVAEACFSTSYPDISRTVCPDGKQRSTARGSSRYCDSEDCFHGTHVAGIAVGNPDTPYKGVANRANLFPIQVFSEFYNEDYCDPFPVPCYESFDSDQMRALEHVLLLTEQFGRDLKVASVNISIGGGDYDKPCNDEDVAPLIGLLRNKKIAVAIASGNDGSDRYINAPGCVTKAITVGSTTKSDDMSFFTNLNRMVDLLAPGSNITAPIPVSTYASYNGTSMAAPHVAGTWALLRQAEPDAGVRRIEKALECSGVPVSRAGITKPRIDVLRAVRALRRGC